MNFGTLLKSLFGNGIPIFLMAVIFGILLTEKILRNSAEKRSLNPTKSAVESRRDTDK